MNASELINLIRQPEGLKLEFKKELYHLNHIQSDVQLREWGEFIKDLMALANGNVGTLGQNGYLIIGVGDRREPDGARKLFGISEFPITSKELLEKLNAYSAPPFADLSAETILLDGYKILVITLPPSPYLHETTKRLQTKKSVFSEHTVFIRRSEHIFPASAQERAAIAAEKFGHKHRLEAGRHIESPIGTDSRRPQLVDSYLRSTIANEHELDRLYIDLSGETRQVGLTQTGFPQGLIPNEFRIIDLEKDPHTQVCQFLYAIDEALEIHNRFVLLGPPGSGKTITLRKLLLDTARRALLDPEQRIPVLINLAHWPENIHDLPDLLAYECQLKGLGNIHFGHLLMLFDGLNEMPAQTYAERIKLIEEWLQVNSSAAVVISCRERDYRENERLSLPTVQVYPLDGNRIKRLIHAYLGEQSAEDLIRQLRPEDVSRRSPRDLIHLASNPYMLTMMAYVYKNFGELPTSRGQLFQLFVKTLYHREEKHGTTEGFTYEELLEGLGNLAFAMQARWSATAVDTIWAVKQVPSGIRANQLWVVGVRASLLHFTDEDRVIQFSHQLLLEYFAAEGLLQKPFGLKNLKKPSFRDSKRRGSRWDEVIYTLAGIANPDEFLPQLSRIDPFLAADCLAHVPGKIAVGEFTKSAILNDLCDLFTSENSQAKQAAIARIAELGESTIPTLIQVLEQGNQVARRAVLQVLAKIGGPAVTEGFVLALTDSKKWVRRDAIDFLEYLVPSSDSEVARLLVDSVLERGPAASKELLQAFSYFCALDNISCVERTIQLLIQDEKDQGFINLILSADNGRIFESVFQTLFLSLQFLTDTKFQHALLALNKLSLAFCDRCEDSLSNRSGNRMPPDIEWLIKLPQIANALEDPTVRSSALELARTFVNSIAMVSVRAEISGNVETVFSEFIEAQTSQTARKTESHRSALSDSRIDHATSITNLIFRLGDPSVVVGRRAGEQLISIGEPAVELLIQALQSSNVALRRRVPRVLAKIGNNAAVQPLRKLLLDSSVTVRLGAVKALAQIGDASAVQDLLPMLEDEASEVRFNALQALAHCGDDNLIQDLIPSLKDPDEWVVIEASKVLLSWGYALATDSLSLIITNDTSTPHRRQAIRVLGHYGGPRAVDSLIEVLLSAQHPEIVTIIAEALGELGDKRAVPPLITVSSSDDVRVRRKVSEILSTFDCPETAGALINLLGDTDHTVRVHAVNGLGRLKNSVALEALITTLFDEDRTVRKHSAQALGQLGDPRAIAPLIQATSDEDGDTLEQILHALGQLGGFGFSRNG